MNNQNLQISKEKKSLDFFSNLIFCTLWIWIAFVSSIDNYLVVKFRNDMPHDEQNPVARFIMYLNDWDVSTFVGIKMFFTIIVLGILAIIYVGSKHYGLKCVTILSLFQAALFYYLMWM
jgi:hypothetical protein